MVVQFLNVRSNTKLLYLRIEKKIAIMIKISIKEIPV